MKYPKFLPEKGTIGFVAPSFGCNTEPYKTAFDSSLEKFKELSDVIVVNRYDNVLSDVKEKVYTKKVN